MRLHRLRVQAFGPFAGTEEVDLDALSASGLFLLHGPTGAGKTSVLDAVCFALYGRVPGARADGAPRLRSDHAAPDLPPEVVCEFSVGPRRFEVTRSPAWQRPKKRGSGTTTEQARTVLREWVDGEWLARSARNDEASQLLTDVLGMGLEQFTKVVLLPQGDFAAFLRAPAEQRRPLLQRLFGTDRFADVEGWLAEERRRLGRQVSDADESLSRLVARADQAAAGVLSAGEDDEAPDPDTDPVGHIDALLVRVAERLAAARTEHGGADAAHRTAVAALERARRRADAARRLAAAVAEQQQLDAETAAVRDADTELERARRAAGVRGHLDGLAAARARAEEAAATLARRRAEAGDEPLPETDSELAVLVRGLHEELARLEDLAAVDAERRAAAAEGAEQAARTTRLAAEIEAADAARADRSAERDRLRTRLQELTPVAAGAAAAAVAVEAAATAAAGAERAAALAVDVEAAEDTLRTRTDEALARRTEWLDVRERRLAGMAAELAAGLGDGQSCPVCGALEHPAPAAPDAAAVSADDERTAHEAAQAAEADRAAAELRLTGLRERHAAAAAASGGLDVEQCAAALAAARADSAAAEQAAAAVAKAGARLQELDGLDAVAAESRSALAAEHAAAHAAAEAASRRVEDLDGRLEAALGADRDLTARRSRLTQRSAVLEAVADARRAHRDAVDGEERCAAAAAEAAAAAGFGDAEDAAAADRPDAEVAALAARVEDHGRRIAAVRARLAEPELVEAAEHARPLEELDAALADRQQHVQAAEHRREAAVRALAHAEHAATALEDLRAHAAADVAATGPLREQQALVASLAACAEGTGGDNALRMRLSAFVLAARLEQVAEAATVRLAGMSDGRYALVHSDAAERRGARSGLGLRVVDGWTGLERDTTTLSGGESFLASLALALGLADVVQAEAGGTAIETLFVDEGFGTLDAETLEEVMATLDGLREGGRAVGVVSHVAELRQRIPTRLEVAKTRTGSHLRLGA